MKLQTLVASLNQDVSKLADRMNLQTDAIIINQSGENTYTEYSHDGHRIRCYTFAEKGVGLSRNSALMRADGDICLFSDEDIVYENGYPEKILEGFSQYPDADLLLFNMEVSRERATYHTKKVTRVHTINSGRYPTYSFAVKREKLHRRNITFSLLFGGGARYSNGEDSLFLRECLKKGLRIYALPVSIGSEVPRESTWFSGYHEKFFRDRGVLYHFLYGCLAMPMAAQFLIRHGSTMCRDIPAGKCFRLMREGIREAKE